MSSTNDLTKQLEGKFTIPVAQGGYAEIYRMRLDGNDVAVKVMKQSKVHKGEEGQMKVSLVDNLDSAEVFS